MDVLNPFYKSGLENTCVHAYVHTQKRMLNDLVLITLWTSKKSIHYEEKMSVRFLYQTLV